MRQKFLDQMNKEICKFVTCGSVDDGKSTLIGRILYDNNAIPNDERKIFEKNRDFASLVDGLSSEKEQGITIDVAYRYFSTQKRRYIISDSPGHEQYTRNMVTAASNADVAIILIDSRHGVLHQTIKHLEIVTLLGIQQIIVAINKMDLISHQKECFEKITQDFKKVASTLPKTQSINISYIPISALLGINVTQSLGEYPWYLGKSIIETLDEIILKQDPTPFRFPIQYVNRQIEDGRGFCGTICGGEISIGDEVVVLPSQKQTKIKKIISPHTNDSYPHKAKNQEAITLILNDEIDIVRGDVLVKKHDKMSISNSFISYLVWFDDYEGQINMDYIFKRSSTTLVGKISDIFHKKDTPFTERDTHNTNICTNDIITCRIILDKRIPLDHFADNKEMGSFILIDRYNNKTLGAGIITQIENPNQNKDKESRYLQFEKELNALIRKFYPEWQCKSI